MYTNHSEDLCRPTYGVHVNMVRLRSYPPFHKAEEVPNTTNNHTRHMTLSFAEMSFSKWKTTPSISFVNHFSDCYSPTIFRFRCCKKPQCHQTVKSEEWTLVQQSCWLASVGSSAHLMLQSTKYRLPLKEPMSIEPCPPQTCRIMCG